MKRIEPITHVVLRVPTLAEYFDHQKLFETLVRRYRGHAANSSFTAAGTPKSFTFSCRVPKSEAAQFKAEWKRRTLDLSIGQKKRLSVAVTRMLNQLHDQLGDDDFNLLIRTFRRPATIRWLLSCITAEAKASRHERRATTPLSSARADDVTARAKGPSIRKRPILVGPRAKL
jgi:hypothetical protein